MQLTVPMAASAESDEVRQAIVTADAEGADMVNMQCVVGVYLAQPTALTLAGVAFTRQDALCRPVGTIIPPLPLRPFVLPRLLRNALGVIGQGLCVCYQHTLAHVLALPLGEGYPLGNDPRRPGVCALGKCDPFGSVHGCHLSPLILAYPAPEVKPPTARGAIATAYH